MKKHSRNTRGPGAWVLGGVASVLMCVSAFGQYAATQPTAITINDNSPATPYPSAIDLTKSNILGTIEKVTVTLTNVKHGYANDVGVLLVAPDGSNVVLMRNAGGGQPINGVTLTFDDAGGALPQFLAIGPGTYAPSDFDPTSDFFPTAPAHPYGSTLSGLKNASPNGVWSLYVEDDSPLNTGTIDSWTLNLYTTPLISLATNYVNLTENGSSSNVSFTLQDSSVPPGGYTVTFAGPATNNFVIATGSVSPSLAGTVTLTPQLNAFGTNTLTVIVNDGLGSVQANLTVAIKHVNQPPTITITNTSLTTIAGAVSPVVNAIVADVDPNDTPNTLTITVSSSNTNLVNPAGVFFDPANPNGLRTFTVVPTGIATGTATLTFTVKDTGGATGSATLPVTVQSVTHPIFASTNLLGLAATGTTNSSIAVSNVSGAIGNLNVSVAGLQKVAGNNLSLALVPPAGPAITLLQNAGSAGPNTFAQLSFAAGSGGSILPSNDTITPVALQAAGLAALVGTNPNGSWSLWATNGGAAGQITGGWVLNIFAAPTITTTVTNISIPEETSTSISFTVASIDGTITNASDVTVVSADPTLLTVSGETFDLSSGIGSAQLNAIFTGPQFGKTTVKVTATDNNNFSVSFTYNVTVTFVNHTPTISFILKQTTRAGVPLGPVPFTVSDVDATTPPQPLTVTATSSDQKVLPDSNILLQTIDNNNRTFTLFPVGNNTGNVQVTFTVNDNSGSNNATASQVFTLAVLPQGNPLFVNPSLITINAATNATPAPATPYPSTIAVSNLLGTISSVQVALFGITHTAPSNLNALLVSPSGTKVLLLGHAGGVNPLSNVTLEFSDAATNMLPYTGQIISGVYQPTNFGTVVPFASAPAGPTNLTLAAFKGLNSTNANGTWSLYIVDDGLGKGLIVNGWQLSIQTDPFVGQIADVTLQENAKTLQIPVSLGDDQPGVDITPSAVSANPGVVQVSFEAGSGGTRILDVTPVPFQTGSNILVTVTAQTLTASSSTNFHVTVYSVNLPPIVSSINDVTSPATTPSPVTYFTAWDPQDSPLTPTATSLDTKLIPTANITISLPTVVGTTNSHTIYQYGISVRSADADVTGTAVIQVSVADAVGQATPVSFNANVTKALVYLSADGPISIPEGYPIASNATPFPSIIAVSNLDGLVTGAKVTLLGFSHGFPADVDVLLVSPDNSKSVVLMAHVGGGTPASNLRLNFDDAGGALTGAPLTSGTFAPTDLAPGLLFAAPAPASGYTTNLSSLAGTSPNGNWKLYVMDDSFPTGGSITGWMLTLETGPAFDLTNLGAQTTPENVTKVVSFGLLDESSDPATLVVTASTNGGVVPTNVLNLIASAVVTNNGGALRTLIITPSANLPSTITNLDATTTIVLTVTDTNGNHLSTSVPITVSYVNQPPVVTAATNTLVLLQGATITTTFTLSDVDSTLYTSNLVVNSTDPNLIPNTTNGLLVTVSTNRIVPGTTGTVTVQVTPTSNVAGTNTITVAITDGTTTTTGTVTVQVQHVYQAPTITGLPSTVTIIAGTSTAVIPFTVASPEGVPTTNLNVTATSTDQTLVPNANILLGGSADSRTIQVTPLGTASGNLTINFKIDDGKATNSSYSFALNILPPPSTLFGNGLVANIVGNATNVHSAPYPITFNVTNLVGSILSVSLEMRGFSNSAPINLDALLVSPDGIPVMLMSGGGGTTPVTGLDLVFADGGSDLTTVNPLVSGTYHPLNVTKRLLPAPAPQTGYESRMAAFSSVATVNGTWNLYLNDLTLGDYGKVTGGFFLTIVTKPFIQVTTTTPVVIPENGSSNVSFTVSDSITAVSNLNVSAFSDNKAMLPAGSITLHQLAPLTSGNWTATLQPVLYQNGSANVFVTATRTNDGASYTATIPVNVPATNFPPVIGRLSNPSVPENTLASFQFLVSDVDTPLSNLVAKVVSANQTLIGDTNIVLVGSTNNANVLYGLPASGVPNTSTLTLNLLPNPYQVGSATLWVIVTDQNPGGTTVSNSFTLTSTVLVYSPTISTIPPQTVSAGLSTPAIGFQVNSLNQTPPQLTVTGVSSDQTIVKNSNIVISPATATSVTNRSVTLTAEAGAKGPVTITLTVKDTVNNLSASSGFTLNVLPTPVHTYAVTTPITINDNAPATPYPSSNYVSGLSGTISKISVTVSNLAHHYPADVGLMLVGPGGQKVVLMNKAGGGTPVTNVNLTFDQAASSAIPNGTPLITGSYKPADYKGTTYDFFSPAPTHPYGTDLTTFNGGSADGAWFLWVQDDTPPDAGVINGGWALNITTQPQINGLGPLTIQENGTNSQPFTIADDSPSGPSYQFGVTSTNAALTPSSGITISGSGTNFTVSIAPAANKFGTSLVTVTATNIDNAVSSSSFLVTVQQVIYPPVILSIADQTTSAGTAISVPVTYYDVQVPTNQLTVTFQSSNPSLIPVANISLLNSQTIQVIPAGAANGSSLITVLVSQPSTNYGLSSKTSFTANVTPVYGLYGTNQPITINDVAPATPYPSTFIVGGLAGNIVSATVTVLGLQHTYPSDISMLLVGPQGQQIVLMSRAGEGAGSAITGVNLTFDDASENVPPQTGLITSGTYKPTDYNGSLQFYPPVVPPYVTNLSVLKGNSPNGTWSLYVQDDLLGDSGLITGGWLVKLVTTAPVISFVGPQTVLENGQLSIPLSVSSALTTGNKLTVTAASSGESVPGLAGSLVVNGPGTNAVTSRTLVITPGLNLPSAQTNGNGTATITLFATDGTNVNTESFPLTVTYVNQPPIIAGLSNQTIPGNGTLSLPFTVADVDTAASSLVVAASSSVSSLGGLKLISSGNNQTINFNPSGSTGQTTVTVTASDGNSTVTNMFTITVTGALPPVFGAIPDQTTSVNVAAVVPLPVTDPVTAVTNLAFAGTSNNSNLVSNVSFAVVGTNVVATVNLVSNQLGTAVITITASDAVTNASQSFNLTVNPPPAPVLAAIADQTNVANLVVVVPLQVSSAVVPISALTFNGSSSNTGLVKSITFAISNGTNVSAMVNLVTNQLGLAQITISVSDNFTNVSQSFALTIVTPPPPVLAAIPDETNLVNSTVSVPLSVSGTPYPISALTFTGKSSNSALVTAIGFTKSGTSATANIVLALNQIGTALVTISVNDGFTTVTQSFNLTVVLPTPPTLGAIANQTTPLNTPTNIQLTVTSPVTPISSLVFTGSGTNGGLVQKVTFAVNGSSVVATVNVVANRVGFDTVTIGASDGFTNVTQTFELTVTPKSQVVLGPIGPHSTTANTPAKIALTVTDPDTSVTNLTFLGVSTNAALVSGVTFSYNGRNMVAVVNLVPNRAGNDYVTISATDGFSRSTQSFALTVSGTALAPTLKVSHSGNQVIVSFTGTPNASYGVQASVDLKNWSNLGTITADASGAASYTNVLSSTIPVAFARVVVQ